MSYGYWEAIATTSGCPSPTLTCLSRYLLLGHLHILLLSFSLYIYHRHSSNSSFHPVFTLITPKKEVPAGKKLGPSLNSQLEPNFESNRQKRCYYKYQADDIYLPNTNSNQHGFKLSLKINPYHQYISSYLNQNISSCKLFSRADFLAHLAIWGFALFSYDRENQVIREGGAYLFNRTS